MLFRFRNSSNNWYIAGHSKTDDNVTNVPIRIDIHYHLIVNYSSKLMVKLAKDKLPLIYIMDGWTICLWSNFANFEKEKKTPLLEMRILSIMTSNTIIV